MSKTVFDQEELNKLWETLGYMRRGVHVPNSDREMVSRDRLKDECHRRYSAAVAELVRKENEVIREMLRRIFNGSPSDAQISKCKMITVSEEPHSTEKHLYVWGRARYGIRTHWVETKCTIECFEIIS